MKLFILITILMTASIVDSACWNLFGYAEVANYADAYLELNQLLVEKVHTSDLEANTEFARWLVTESREKLEERRETGETKKETDKTKEEMIMDLIEALARVEEGPFGMCETENLNSIKELTEARDQALGYYKRLKADRLNGLLDGYLAEAALKCYEPLVTSWSTESDKLFNDMYGWNITQLDQILVSQASLFSETSQFEEARKLNVAVLASKPKRKTENVFSKRDLKTILAKIRSFYPKSVIDKSFIKEHLKVPCKRFMERPDTIGSIRPIADLAVATTGGLSDRSLDGWFQDGNDGNHALEWAARYVLCSRVAQLDEEKVSSLIN